MLDGVQVLRPSVALVAGTGGVGGVAQGVFEKSKKSRRLGCAASRDVRYSRSNEAVFDESDDCGVIHRDVGDVMSPGEGRDDDVGDAKADLRAEPVDRSGIAGVSTGAVRPEVAVRGGRRGGRHARLETVWTHGNAGDIDRIIRLIRGVGLVVRVVWDGWHVIVGAAAFVVAEEEDAVLPLGAGHEGIDDVRHLLLTEEDGLK